MEQLPFSTRVPGEVADRHYFFYQKLLNTSFIWYLTQYFLLCIASSVLEYIEDFIFCTCIYLELIRKINFFF